MNGCLEGRKKGRVNGRIDGRRDGLSEGELVGKWVDEWVDFFSHFQHTGCCQKKEVSGSSRAGSESKRELEAWGDPKI